MPMNIIKIATVYFSPTGTTKKLLTILLRELAEK